MQQEGDEGINYDDPLAMYNNDGLTIPNVLEVTFVHGNARPNGCNGYQEYDDALDTPNNAGNGELPMAHMG